MGVNVNLGRVHDMLKLGRKLLIVVMKRNVIGIKYIDNVISGVQL